MKEVSIYIAVTDLSIEGLMKKINDLAKKGMKMVGGITTDMENGSIYQYIAVMERQIHID